MCKQGVVDVVPNEQGSRVTPAVVAFTDVETLLGEAARGQQARNPTNTIVQGLRLLGREMEEEALQAELKAWRFRVQLMPVKSHTKFHPMRFVVCIVV